MLNNKLFLFLLTTSAPLFAMQAPKELQPWVKSASEIKVRTVLKNGMKVTIDDNTTVWQVKEKLYDLEGIPAHQQSMYALFTNWKSLWLIDSRSEKLTNNLNIKEIMNTNNSDRFLLALSLRPNSDGN